MTTWTITLGITDHTPESLGVEVLGGVFRSGSASSVQLRCIMPADAAQIADYDDVVLIKRNGSPFFRGKIRAIPKSMRVASEVQEYLVEDAWAEMERTTYQEPWATHTGTVLQPRVYLGVNSAGERITLGQQITAALDFAVAAGISLQKGSIPEGMLLWPTEADGLSVAEVIRTSLRYHPDWIPWINHTTSPPTLNVTARSAAAVMSIPMGSFSDLEITEVEDRLPASVRVVFETVNDFDGEIEREVAVQKWPTSSPESGPGVLTTTVELQGVRTVVQKQQIEVRNFPDDQASAKTYIKSKYPALKDVPDGAYNITEFAREIIPDEAGTKPPAINPNATRLVGTTFAHLPRELVSGTIHEWMRRRVGRVRLEWELTATGSATAEHLDLLARIPKGVTVTGTNATKKVYRSTASWTGAETAPPGIAKAYYETIHASCRHEGTITLLSDELATPWHGKKLRVTGGAADWATMDAPIHAVTWDAETDEVSISFGPTPDYAFQDFYEYLRLLNARSPSWISTAERTSAEIGDGAGPSSAGDVIGPLDVPHDEPEFTGGGEVAPGPWDLSVAADGEDWKFAVASEGSTIIKSLSNEDLGIEITNLGAPMDLSSGANYIVLEATIDNLAVTALEIKSVGTRPDIYTPTNGQPQTKTTRLIGIVSVNGDAVDVQQITSTPLTLEWYFQGVQLLILRPY